MNRSSVILFSFIIIVNLIFNAIFQLHYDESYYWAWSQNLSLSYYDHPPMLAYMIWVSNHFGHSEFWVRLPALVTLAITVFTGFKLALRMFGQEVGNFALKLLLCVPLVNALFFITTPDSPLFMFWMLTLYAFYIAIFENKVKYLYLAGLYAGLALLSKYTAILIFPGMFLFLIFSQYRYVLARIHIYLAFILTILVFSPVIIWNYHQDWISFTYQFHHGIDLSKQHLDGMWDYLGSQLAVSGPFIFLSTIYYLFRKFKTNFTDPKLAYLLWNFLFGYLIFLYFSTGKHIEGNWAGPVYLSSTIFTAYWLFQNKNRWIFYTSLGFILLAITVTKFPQVFMPKQLRNKVPAINVFFGNKQLVDHLSKYIQDPNQVVVGCDYGNTSRAWFYLHLPRAYILNDLPYANSYRYWNNNQLDLNKLNSIIYFCDGQDITDYNIIKSHFKHVDLLENATYSNTVADNHIYIYKAYN